MFKYNTKSGILPLYKNCKHRNAVSNSTQEHQRTRNKKKNNIFQPYPKLGTLQLMAKLEINNQYDCNH